MEKVCIKCKKQKEISKFYKCKDKIFPYCADCNKEKSRQWYLKNKAKHDARNSTRYIEIRNESFKILGNKCVNCNNNDLRVLCIDHIDGDGSLERIPMKGRGSIVLNILVKLRTGKHRYQLLCRNCNWVKALENNELVRK